MVFITGGRAQGKTELAERMFFSDSEEHVLVDRLNDMIRVWLEKYGNGAEAGELAERFAGGFLKDLPENAVIICDEVGCGIVPVERSERLYRDVVGRVSCVLAARSSMVIRVRCGIGQVIKGDR